MSKQRSKKRQESDQPAGSAPYWPWVVGIVLLIVYAATSAGRGAAGPEQWPDPELAQRGEGVFAANCASCHGARAEGQDPLQPMGGEMAGGIPLAPALNGTGHAWHHKPAMLFSHIKTGSPMPGSPMVAFGDRLTDDEIRAVIAWFQSLWPPEIADRYGRANSR